MFDPVDLDLDPTAISELEADLDRLAPERPLDPGALDRAFYRLTTHLAQDEIELPRTGHTLVATPIRRRVLATLVAAAVATGGLVALEGRAAHRAPPASHASSTDHVLLQLVSRFENLAAVPPGSYVKIASRFTQDTGAVASQGEVPNGRAAEHQDRSTTVYRPASLTDPERPWVFLGPDGQPRAPKITRCGGGSYVDPCAGGSWTDASALFLAHRLETRTPEAVAREYMTHLAQVARDDRVHGPFFEAFGWLQDSAGDANVAATIFEMFRIAAASDKTISAAKVGEDFVISRVDPDGSTVTYRINAETGDLSARASWPATAARMLSGKVVIAPIPAGTMSLTVHSAVVPANTVPGLN
ncbi:MAG TPA: hypothetical protein VJ831_12695 [Jatrophihabitantaceae bacterium]|nr:hypothetical protein [Jatrophihabitantaceae bacterium]